MSATSHDGTGPADRLFALYQRGGDPDLLARVFDETAKHLLRVAIHLARDLAEAEDLVQATFVTAMEKAATFRPGHPVLPWLSGILELHARAARSRARRQIAPDRLPEPATLDPERAARENELDDAVRRGLDRLPESQRTILVLKLRHGLSPAQIADVLGKSPGAVRVQIHRGLQTLRRHLPVGLALSAVCVITPTRGLAAMRADLRRRAALHLAATGQGILLGGILMKKTAAFLAAAALALGSLFLWSPWEPRQSPIDTPATAGRLADAAPDHRARGLSSATGSGAAAPAAAAPADPERREVPAEAAPHGGSLVVRARWSDDKTPAPGVGLTLRPHDGRHPELHTRRAVTAETGVARFTELAPGEVGIYVDRQAHFAPEPAAARDPSPPGWGGLDAQVLANLRLIDWGMQDIARVRLQEVVASAWTSAVIAQHIELELPGRIEDPPRAHRELDSDGALIDLGARDAAAALDAPSKLPDEAPLAVRRVGQELVIVDVLVERGIDVDGRVVGPDARGVAGAGVFVIGKDGHDAHEVTRTDEHGRFALCGIEATSRIAVRAAGYEPSAPLRIDPAEGGRTRTIEIELSGRAGSLRGVVVDPHGQPIAGASLRIGTRGAGGGGDSAGERGGAGLPPVYVRTGEDGRFEAVGLPIGRLPVLALAPGFQPHQQDVLLAPGRVTESVVRMEPGWILSGRVLDQDGDGKPSVTIYADADGKPTTEITSGPDGAFRLECLPPGPVTLRAEEDDDHRALSVPVHGQTGQELEQDLCLPAWGEIAGRLLGTGGEPLAGWTVRARPASPTAAGGVRHARTDEHGAFELRTDPGARYRLEVNPRAFPYRLSGALRLEGGRILYAMIGHDDPDAPPPGRRTIACTWLGALRGDRSGAEGPLLIRVPQDLLPSAHVSGRLVDPGGAPLRGEVRVHVDDRYRAVEPDADGSFDIGPLIPGAYRFEVVGKDGSFAPFDLGVTALAPDERVDAGDVAPPRQAGR